MTRLARLTFASLAVRNYRLYFLGMLVSSCGTWMQSVAQGWLVLRLTGSGTAVGLVIAMQFVPTLVGGMWGGVVADRFDKRRTLLATQAAMALVAAALATVTLTGVVTLWMVFAAAFLTGCSTVVDTPTRQAFVSELVGAERLANAVALNSAMFNAARVVGPAIAGGVILAAGTGACFALNAVSYAAVIAGLAAMRKEELHRGAPAAKAKGQVREGLRYVMSTPALRSTLLLVAVVGTFALNFTVLLPLLARFTFDAGPGTLGLLTSTMGLGSLGGALTAAARGNPSPRLLAGAAGTLGLAMTGIAVAPTLPIAVAFLAVAGASAITFLATANSLLQLTSSAEMRGRVMALYALVFLGSTPIGGPIVGVVAQRFDPRAGFLVGAAAALAGALGSLRRLRRPGLDGGPLLGDRVGEHPATVAGDENVVLDADADAA
jgi:MFS family permease